MNIHSKCDVLCAWGEKATYHCMTYILNVVRSFVLITLDVTLHKFRHSHSVGWKCENVGMI